MQPEHRMNQDAGWTRDWRPLYLRHGLRYHDSLAFRTMTQVLNAMDPHRDRYWIPRLLLELSKPETRTSSGLAFYSPAVAQRNNNVDMQFCPSFMHFNRNYDVERSILAFACVWSSGFSVRADNETISALCQAAGFSLAWGRYSSMGRRLPAKTKRCIFKRFEKKLARVRILKQNWRDQCLQMDGKTRPPWERAKI